MKLILTGCEYAGKRTLARNIALWWEEQTGEAAPEAPHTGFHDHFVVPNVIHAQGHESHKEKSEEEILTLNPGLLEHFQRYQIDYHFSRGFMESPDIWFIDWYYGEPVYAPLYHGYGRPGEYGDRRVMVRHWDDEVMEHAPDMVLVLVKASPQRIRQRLRENPHARSLFREKDIEFVLDRFQEEYDNSLIDRRFELDTTETTAEKTLAQFTERIRGHLTRKDRVRILSHQSHGKG